MKLEKKVHAVNEVNRIAKLNFDHVISIMKPFIGQQIILKSGSKSAKFLKAINYLNEQPKQFGNDYAQLHNVYLNFSYYSIWLNISCSFKNNETSCFYEETSVYIGDIDKETGILKELNQNPPEFLQYDVEGIRTMLQLKKQHEEELSKLKSRLYKFDGHYE